MPACKHGQVQTNTTDGRKFITLKVGSNGAVLYRRVYLRTKDARVARKRAGVLEGILDPAEARRLIQYLDSSKTPEEEQRRIAELSPNTPVIFSKTQAMARQELEGIVCDFGDYAPGELDEDVVDEWRRADSFREWRTILLRLGVPDGYLSENAERPTRHTLPIYWPLTKGGGSGRKGHTRSGRYHHTETPRESTQHGASPPTPCGSAYIVPIVNLFTIGIPPVRNSPQQPRSAILWLDYSLGGTIQRYG
jgi:hypothetical protein